MKQLLLFLVAMSGVSLAFGQLEVTTSGVGIGTSSPATALHVIGPNASSPLWQSEVVRVTAGHTAGLGIDAAGSNWGVSLFQDGTKRFTVEENGGALIGGSYVHLNAPANGLAVEGWVGVGMISPRAPLDVYHASTPAIFVSGPTGTSPFIAFHQNLVESAYLQFVEVGATDRLDLQSDGDIAFKTTGEKVRILQNGNVGIGTNAPGYPLEVNGSVRATSFISNSTTYADFVFKPGYRLAPLSEVEAHIATKGHLPDIPSEAEAKAHGIDLAAMQVKLLQKVEELTLHAIAQAREIAALKEENRRQTQKLEALSGIHPNDPQP